MKTPAVMLDWIMAAAMSMLLPIGPIVATALSGDKSYMRAYWRTIVKGVGHLRGQVESRAFSRYVLYSRRQRPTSQKIIGSCTNCGKCCLNKKCIFLDWTESGQSSCRIYGSRFWSGLACGRYPEDQFDIDLYECPSFFSVAVGTRERKRKHIPIVAAAPQRQRRRATMR